MKADYIPATITLRDYFRNVFKFDGRRSKLVNNDYRNAVSRFCRFAGEGVQIAGITRAKLEEFATWSMAQGSQQYANNLLMYLRALLRVYNPGHPALVLDEPATRPKRPEIVPVEPVPEHVPQGGGVPLAKFIATYATPRDLRPDTVRQLRYAVAALNTWAGWQVLTGELCAKLLNEWIEARIESGKSRKTVHGQRGAILSLWRKAHRHGLASPLAEVRKVKVPKPIPEAWTPEEFAKLLISIDYLEGYCRCGIKRCVMLRAFCLLGYYSGLRPCDLLALRSADVLTGERIVIRQQKTGVPIRLTVPPDAMQAVLATRPAERERVFPFTRKMLWYWFRRVLRGQRGSSKWLRRFGATQCEIKQPGSAMAFLGHLTPGLAYKHYVDMRQIADNRPTPPTITTGPIEAWGIA